jgi:hypothetical protein
MRFKRVIESIVGDGLSSKWLAGAMLIACGSCSASTGGPSSAPPGDAGFQDHALRDGTGENAKDSSEAAADGGGGDATTPEACPGEGDPVACDDGTGSLGTKTACPLSVEPLSKESYHLKVSGSKFATSGACVYVTPSTCAIAKGDVMEFSGSGGTTPADGLDKSLQATPYCFRVLGVVWDSDWEDDGMTTGGPVGMGGDVLAASQKPEAVIQWVHDHERTSASTPFCARGGSGGSSELLYQLMHNDGEALLDHVQVISVTPFGRIDKGCDPTSPSEGSNVVCSALPATTEPQYNAAAPLVRTITHDPNCDVEGSSLSTSERSALEAMSLVPSGFAPLILTKTSLSAYMCSNMPNATQGQAVDVFGTHADLATATAGYTGLISLNLGTAFYGCASGSSCIPHIVCGADCSGEGYGTSKADEDELLADMQTNCVARH